MNSAKPKIFLSYAHEDIGMAKRIFNDLKHYDIDIWFDNESLLPGEKWQVAIEKAIKNSAFYLVLLSSNSMHKRGFLQKELKMALEILEQCPEDDIYMIPVRLDECHPSHIRITDLHWIDLFPESEYEKGIQKILKVIHPAGFYLRNQPIELSEQEVVDMLRRYGYYDSIRNPGAKGIPHQYRLQEINNEKVVLDMTTNLIWQQSGSPAEINYKTAEKWLIELNLHGYEGYNDWRFPTLEEAMSLMECTRKNANLYIDLIFDNQQVWIWTADQVRNKERKWDVGFNYGNCNFNDFNHDYYVRAVRSNKK